MYRLLYDKDKGYCAIGKIETDFEEKKEDILSTLAPFRKLIELEEAVFEAEKFTYTINDDR
jgi:hypothetical protein